MELIHRPLFLDDVKEVLRLQLRAEDQEELRAASGRTPEAALEIAVRSSSEVFVLLLDRRIVGLFGVAAPGGPHAAAAPWLLSTDALFSAGLSGLFSRGARDVVAQMLAKWNRLENFVAVKNKKAIRFLDWLGFEFGETVTLVDPSVKFIKFSLKAQGGGSV